MSEQSSTSPSSTRIMVAIGINPYSLQLLQAAVRLAQGLDGTVLAVHIRAPGTATSLYQANLAWHFEQAHALGVDTEVIEGRNIAATLVQHAQQHDVTHLVLGLSDVTRWREIRGGSVVNQLLREIARRQANLDLYIVTGSNRA